MPTDTIELSRILPATPARIYAAWLDATEHGAMTGSPATVESTRIGGRFTAWDGYIDGSHLALEPGSRIVQSWRSDDFPADALDSLLEVRLEPVPGGTRVTLRHSDLPEGQGPALLEAWEEFYLEPMERYFSKGRAGARPAPKKAAPRRAKRKPARKTARIPARKPVPVRKAVQGRPRKASPRRPAAKKSRKGATRRPAKRTGARRR